MSEPPPPRENQRLSTVFDRPGWWKRNWKVALPVIIATPIMATVMCALGAWWGIDQVVRQHPTYAAVWPAVRDDPAVIAALGRPIEEGWAGSIAIDEAPDGTASAYLVFNIRGPNGDATVEARGVRNATTWMVESIAVHTRTDMGKQTIDVDKNGK